MKCKKLTILNISKFDFLKVTSYTNMFNSVPTTIKIIAKDDNASNYIQNNISSNYINIVTTTEI